MHHLPAYHCASSQESIRATSADCTEVNRFSPAPALASPFSPSPLRAKLFHGQQGAPVWCRGSRDKPDSSATTVTTTITAAAAAAKLEKQARRQPDSKVIGLIAPHKLQGTAEALVAPGQGCVDDVLAIAADSDEAAVGVVLQ